MFFYLLKRLGVLIPTLLGVLLLTFVMVRLVPGDPVMVMLGERGADPLVYEQMKASLGLDLPVWQQFLVYISKVVQGDFGISTLSKQSVLSEFWSRFPATLELGIAALGLAILFGIPIGVVAATRRNSVFDYTFITASLAGYSMPIFWWGLILIIVFSVGLGWTPVSGRISILYDVEPVTGFLLIDSWLGEEGGWEVFRSALSHIVLPAIAMGTIPLAVISRMTRSSLLEVLGEDYVRTAKAKGVRRLRVVWVHALRNALIPIVTVVGLMFGSIITGAILTESIFSWPGIGKWLVHSVTSRDYPVVQGGVFFIASMIVIVNLLVDLAYAWVNPKLRV